MNDKEKYRDLCRNEETIPLFNKDWWLDAVCGRDEWDVLTVEQDSKIVAAMPYRITVNKWRIKQIIMPKLTQTNGLWIKYPKNQKYVTRLSYEKNIIDKIAELLDGLGIGYFSQNFSYNLTNWLPFYWKGFKQTTRYTYVIENLDDIERVVGDLDAKKRNIIKKATKNLHVGFDLGIREFYDFHRRVLSRQARQIAYSFSLFERICNEAFSHNCGKILKCFDSSKDVHAAQMVVWDRNSAYHLINAMDPDFKSSGAVAFLLLETIKYVSDKTKRFDFEGSMVEEYEIAYRKFGGIQKPYFNISKKYSPLFIIGTGIAEVKYGTKQLLKSVVRGKKDE